MKYGMVTDCIALDTRLYNVFVKLGINIPALEEIQRSSRVCSKVEDSILQSICKPIDMKGIELDRMLYQNYNNILLNIS